MARSDSSSKRVRLLSSLVVLAVFAAGIAAGFGLSRWLAESEPPPHPGWNLQPPSLEALHLTAAQEAKAREIGDRYRPEIDVVRREVAPKIRAIHERMKKEMEVYLTPKQRAKQDERPDRPLPPPMALAACEGRSAEDACRFEGPRGPVEGTCRPGPSPGDPLACAPSGGPAF
jgi:hypothetical protein